MAITRTYLGGDVSSGGSSISTINVTVDTTGYTNLLVKAFHRGASTTMSVTDNKGSGTYNKITAINHALNDANAQLHWVKIGSPGTSTTVTLTLAASRTFLRLAVYGIASGLGSMVQNGVTRNAQDQSGTAVSALDITTSAATVAFMLVGASTTVTFTQGSGWTEALDDVITAQSLASGIATDLTPSCNASVACDWVLTSAAFSESAPATRITIGVLPTEASANNASPTVTLTGTTGGHGVVVCIGWNSNTTLTAVDVGGQAASIAPTAYYNATLNSKLQFAYLPSLSSGGSKVITGTLSVGTWWTIYGVTLIGADTATFLDSENGGTGNGTNPSISLTTLSANCAIFSMCSTQGSDPTQGAEYSPIPLSDFNVVEAGEYDLDAGTAGAKTVDYVSTTGQWVVAAAAFKLPASGAIFPARWIA